MRVALFAAVATAALQHGPLRLPPRLRLGRAPPVVLTAKKRTFEFCSVDDAGEIESCELVTGQVSQSAPRSYAIRFRLGASSAALARHTPEEPLVRVRVRVRVRVGQAPLPDEPEEPT
jgi:hypothetical protein